MHSYFVQVQVMKNAWIPVVKLMIIAPRARIDTDVTDDVIVELVF